MRSKSIPGCEAPSSRKASSTVDAPRAAFVHSFPGGTPMGMECAVPVVYKHYWIQTVPALPGLIALDVSDPAKPVEVSRLMLDERYPMPHWLAADRRSGRLVVTGDGGSWVLIVEFDEETGALTVDDAFRDEGALSTNRNPSWMSFRTFRYHRKSSQRQIPRWISICR